MSGLPKGRIRNSRDFCGVANVSVVTFIGFILVTTFDCANAVGSVVPSPVRLFVGDRLLHRSSKVDGVRFNGLGTEVFRVNAAATFACADPCLRLSLRSSFRRRATGGSTYSNCRCFLWTTDILLYGFFIVRSSCIVSPIPRRCPRRCPLRAFLSVCIRCRLPSHTLCTRGYSRPYMCRSL